MTKKKRQETPEWAWEQKLIDDYYDYRWRQVLDPLYEQMRQWKAGELGHHDIDQAIHVTHKMNQELYTLFTNRRDFLISLIQMDRQWFEPWSAEHPAPGGGGAATAVSRVGRFSHLLVERFGKSFYKVGAEQICRAGKRPFGFVKEVSA